jgi:WD40 repeat protein
MDGVRSLNLHPNKKILLSTGKDGSARVWDCSGIHHPKILSNLVLHDENVTAGCFMGE